MIKLFTALFAASLLMQPVPVPDYTPSEADVTALARMAWGEARGLADYEIAACMWCVMNRIDAGYGDTVQDVVSAPGHLWFSGDGVHNYFRDTYDGAGVLPEEVSR